MSEPIANNLSRSYCTNSTMSSPTSHRSHTTSVHAVSPRSSSSSLESKSPLPVEPRSVYLRHALDAKRARHISPAPIVTTLTKADEIPASTLRSRSSDPWLDEAKVFDDAPAASPMRKHRRPSENGLSRARTQRELQVEKDSMAQELFDLRMKLELVRQQSNDLKDQIDVANKRIEELEPYERLVHDLRDENNMLQMKLGDAQDAVDELREQNTEVLQIQEECVTNLEKQEGALEEAAEIIVSLESEKHALSRENLRLRMDCTNFQQAASSSVPSLPQAGLEDRFPARICSIDESRPSTSHFDSDYFSQCDSPQTKANKYDNAPALRINASYVAQSFLSANEENVRSTRELRKKLSAASIKRTKSTSSLSEIPPVPKLPQSDRPPQPIAQTPQRSRQSAVLSPALASLPTYAIQSSTGPVTPTQNTTGLRGRYHGGRTADPRSRTVQQQPDLTTSPLETRRRSITPRPMTGPPASLQSCRHHSYDQSSRQYRLSVSITPATPAITMHEPDSKADGTTPLSASGTTEVTTPPSVASDKTSLTDADLDPRDLWWKNVDKLQHQPPQPQQQQQTASFTPAKPRMSLPLLSSGPNASARTSAGRSTPHPQERNFLFNPIEDEDMFIRKACGAITGRREDGHVEGNW